jgi:hypothetical protein
MLGMLASAASALGGEDATRQALVTTVMTDTSFGQAIAVLGDVDGDRVPDLAIGAPRDSARGPTYGCIFVVSGRDGRLLLRCFGRAGDDRLGSVVRSGADLDGDGLHDVIASPEPRYEVGATSGENFRGFSSRNGAAISAIPTGVAWKGVDLDHDGVDERLASQVDVEAYVVSSRNEQPIRVFPAQRPGGYAEGFGASVAWAGDVDRDGMIDVAVGCFEWIDSGDDYYVTIFSGRDAHVIRLLDAGNRMAVVGEAGDFDLDGIPDLPVGLPELDSVVVLDGSRLGPRGEAVHVRSGEWPVLRSFRRDHYPISDAPALPTPTFPR